MPRRPTAPGTLHRGPLLIRLGNHRELPTPWLHERRGCLHYLYPRGEHGLLRTLRGLGHIEWRSAWEGAFFSTLWDKHVHIVRLPKGEETWRLDARTVQRLARTNPNHGAQKTLPIHELALAWNGLLELWGLTENDGEKLAMHMLTEFSNLGVSEAEATTAARVR